jgi:predicted transcriptional regulator
MNPPGIAEKAKIFKRSIDYLIILPYTSSRLESSMAGASLKKAVYEQLARIGKAVASPPRLELLDLLCQGPRTVEALAHEAGLSVANTSQHLQVLHSARLVQAQKEGLFVT